jgi:selenocysteine lyase/cysteine desulfurase
MSSTEYFGRLFEKVSTTDNTPFLCVPKALEFRQKVCGGEDAIRQYCERIAADGGKRVAELLGTEVLPTSQACCFTNVRLPLRFPEGEGQGQRIAKWIEEMTAREYETYIPTHFYEGGFWCRLSGQIYLTIEDFEWAAKILQELCDRAKAGEWKDG